MSALSKKQKYTELYPLLAGFHVSLEALETRAIHSFDVPPKPLNVVCVDPGLRIYTVLFVFHGAVYVAQAHKLGVYIQFVCPHTRGGGGEVNNEWQDGGCLPTLILAQEKDVRTADVTVSPYFNTTMSHQHVLVRRPRLYRLLHVRTVSSHTTIHPSLPHV